MERIYKEQFSQVAEWQTQLESSYNATVNVVEL